MKAIFSFKDPHLGSVHIVLPKVREVSKGLGSVVITFDNGEKRNIEHKQPEELIKEIVTAIDAFYAR